MPGNPDQPGENIHEQAEINEAFLETNIGNISHPDLILTRDHKVFEAVAPRLFFRCLTPPSTVQQAAQGERYASRHHSTAYQ